MGQLGPQAVPRPTVSPGDRPRRHGDDSTCTALSRNEATKAVVRCAWERSTSDRRRARFVPAGMMPLPSRGARRSHPSAATGKRETDKTGYPIDRGARHDLMVRVRQERTCFVSNFGSICVLPDADSSRSAESWPAVLPAWTRYYQTQDLPALFLLLGERRLCFMVVRPFFILCV